MVKALLIGTPTDGDRLSLLAQRLQSLGYDTAVELTNTVPADKHGPERMAGPDGVAASPTPIICWTRASIGPDGAALRARALGLKEHNDYLGLLLDDVTPPEDIRAAQDVSIIGWEAANRKQLEPLIDALLRRVGDAPKHSVFLALAQSLRSLIERIEHLHIRLKALGVVAVVTLVISVFGLFADWVASQDQICQWSPVTGLCRALAVGHIPSLAEENDWKVIASGSSCPAFEAYLRTYGPSAAFAPEARQRVALARAEAIKHEVMLPLAVSWAERSSATEAVARAEVTDRAAIEAQQLCAISSQAFAVAPATYGKDEAATGVFASGNVAQCTVHGRGFVCRWRGEARCTFLMPGEVRTCRPTDSSDGRTRN